MSSASRSGLAKRKGWVDVDARHFHRLRVEQRARVGFDVGADGGARREAAIGIEDDRQGGDFQQGMLGVVEAAGLDVHDHGQEAAEALGHPRL